ncbi:MAG: hypothetical protein IT168_24085 [Bryobacterales bacterium]|nr:hypothetical protein [Bryobacterales bacterium]
MSKKLTRRQWTVSLTAAASVPALAQTRRNDDVEKADPVAQARQLNDSHRKALAAFKLDRSVEPAFRFEA